MTWGDDLAAQLLGATIPRGFVSCYSVYETPASAGALIALADLKTALGITGADQDAELTRLIGVYSQAVEHYLERRLAQETTEVVIIPRPSCRPDYIALPQFPVSEITYMDVDGSEQDVSLLILDGYSGKLWSGTGSSWAISRYAHVKYTAGYDPVPPDVQDAMVQLVNRALTTNVSSGETGPLKSRRVEGAVTESYYDSRETGSSSSSTPALDVGRFQDTLDYYRSVRTVI